LINSVIMGKDNYGSILIFCSTKKKVSDIARSLKGNGYQVEGISSDLEQKEREDVLQRFISRKTRVLVATDVLSRGIDIKEIDLIINYDVPRDAEDYVHRIGRTARAEASGVALTLVKEEEMYNFHRIEKFIDTEVIKIPLPAELGVAPVWNPKPFKAAKPFFKRNGVKSGGNFRKRA
jgi:ATP-dependent RNA helicase RhlE